jgi:4-hydroxyphenylpyruvate dioxygenase-like putative hemolysin
LRIPFGAINATVLAEPVRDDIAKPGRPSKFADEQLDRMRRFSIQHDRQGTGEFFQFYTLAFEQRFFFEVVQGTGSYDLHGAPNAPVRMAALAHHRGVSRTFLEQV